MAEHRQTLAMTKKEFVFRHLRERILAGKLEPGSKLVIGAIARELGVSDIPVREALETLKAEGLVKGVAHTNAVVSPICFKEVEEALEGRQVLEPYCARKATENIATKDIEKLEELIEEMEGARLKEDYEEYGRLNREFHELIYGRSENATLCEIVERLWRQSERLRAVFKHRHLRMKESNAEHREIVDALKKGDAQRVAEVIALQRERSSRSFLNWLEGYHEDGEGQSR